MLKHRVVSGVLFGAGALLTAHLCPAWAVLIVLVGLTAWAQWEFYAMMTMAGIPVYRYIGILSGSVLVAATFFTIGPDPVHVARAYQWEQLVLLLVVIATFVRQFPQSRNTQPLATISCTLLGIWYVPFLFNFFTRLAFGWERSSMSEPVGQTGRLLVLYLVIVVKFSDIGAYFVGRLLGRHKLFPRLSPGKTWEGLIGGFATAVAASLIFRACTGGSLGMVPLPLAHAIGLALLLAVAGVAGDLFESLLKRAAGAKDSSASVPGMGGVLDVLDSLIFGAPILFGYARWFLS